MNLVGSFWCPGFLVLSERTGRKRHLQTFKPKALNARLWLAFTPFDTKHMAALEQVVIPDG